MQQWVIKGKAQSRELQEAMEEYLELHLHDPADGDTGDEAGSQPYGFRPDKNCLYKLNRNIHGFLFLVKALAPQGKFRT